MRPLEAERLGLPLSRSASILKEASCATSSHSVRRTIRKMFCGCRPTSVSTGLFAAYSFCHFEPIGRSPWLVMPRPDARSRNAPELTHQYGLELFAMVPTSSSRPSTPNAYVNGSFTAAVVAASAWRSAPSFAISASSLVKNPPMTAAAMAVAPSVRTLTKRFIVRFRTDAILENGRREAVIRSEDADRAAGGDEDLEGLIHPRGLVGERLVAVLAVEPRGDARLVHRGVRDLGVARLGVAAPDAQQELHRDAVPLGAERIRDGLEQAPAEAQESAARVGDRPARDLAHPERRRRVQQTAIGRDVRDVGAGVEARADDDVGAAVQSADHVGKERGVVLAVA